MTGESWQRAADRLAAESVGRGEATAWFEELYASARRGEVDTPWDRSAPNPALTAWAEQQPEHGEGRSAVVVGAGLGADAGFLAGLGYPTTAFDVSPTAVEEATRRLAAAGRGDVAVVVADLLALPEGWRRRFDLVVEVFTVQALPRDLRGQVVAAVASLVAAGGTLLVVQAVPPADDDGSGPPWLVSRDELGWLTRHGLELVSLEVVDADGPRPLHLAVLHRPAPGG